MQAIIIEDEPRAARRLEKLIQEVDASIQIIATLESIQDSKSFLSQNPKIDLIFSDIELADGLSFDIYESLTTLPPIIFTTAYDQYAIKAFKNNGIDYLLKPVELLDLQKAIQKLKSLSSPTIDTSVLQLLAAQLKPEKKTYKDRFMVKVGPHIKTILTANISAFYSLDKGTYAFTNDQRNYVLDYSLEQLEEAMDRQRFFRINRNFIICIDATMDIVAWSNSRLKIDVPGYTEDLIIVSRNKTKEFKIWLGDS